MVEITDISILKKEEENSTDTPANSKSPFRHRAPRRLQRNNCYLSHQMSGRDSGDNIKLLPESC
jgi:hypothetical protein